MGGGHDSYPNQLLDHSFYRKLAVEKFSPLSLHLNFLKSAGGGGHDPHPSITRELFKCRWLRQFSICTSLICVSYYYCEPLYKNQQRKAFFYF